MSSSSSNMMSQYASLSSSTKQDSCFDMGLCPDLLVAMVAAMAGLGFTMLYQAVTAAADRGRRKRRSNTSRKTAFQVFSDALTLDNSNGKRKYGK